MADLKINADFTQPVAIDTTRLSWTPSPAAGVLRKRLHLDGPVEAGRVTSIVKYLPGTTFAPHAHPEGEEIFVLSGAFGDEHGRYPAGTYMLNPDGTTHAPVVDEGCVIFVKLRQYPGEGRFHGTVDTNALDWRRADSDGVFEKTLYRQDGFSEHVRLVQIDPDAPSFESSAPGGEEIYVVSGALRDEAGLYRAGTWLRSPPGATAWRSAPEGCTLLWREGWMGKT